MVEHLLKISLCLKVTVSQWIFTKRLLILLILILVCSVRNLSLTLRSGTCSLSRIVLILVKVHWPVTISHTHILLRLHVHNNKRGHFIDPLKNAYGKHLRFVVKLFTFLYIHIFFKNKFRDFFSCGGFYTHFINASEQIIFIEANVFIKGIENCVTTLGIGLEVF